MRVRVPAALIDAIDRAAHRDLLSRSGYIRQAVIARLRADGVGIEEAQALSERNNNPVRVPGTNHRLSRGGRQRRSGIAR